jgi:diguanylate cyclase (GGDEF)-like protein
LSFEQEHAVILNRWLGRNKPVLVAAGLGFVLLMGLVDILTGYDIAFSIFYLIPIALVTWLGGLRNGLFIGLVASMVWTFADYRDVNYRHPLIVYWNMLSSLGIFTVLAIALARLRASLDREKALARTDHLTGTANGRAFAEMLEVENNISLRYAHPFTLIYMDVDNFKTVNDTLGHHAGDTVLTAIAGTIRREIRDTDAVARLGGDEFAVLLRETGYEAAAPTIAKLRGSLAAMASAARWPITFSIGAASFSRSPDRSAANLLRRADALMYAVKNSTKNGLRHENMPS